MSFTHVSFVQSSRFRFRCVVFAIANVCMLIPFISFISFCFVSARDSQILALKPLISNIYRVSVYNSSNRWKHPNFISMWSSICVKIDPKCLSVNDVVDDYNDSDSTIGSCLIRTFVYTANQITSSFVHTHTHPYSNRIHAIFFS